MTDTQIGKIYDSLCDQADEVLKKINPCQGSGSNCTLKDGGRSWCCAGCKHLGQDGCKTKSLSCKLWLCGAAVEKFPLAHLMMKSLAKKAARLGFYQVLR